MTTPKAKLAGLALIAALCAGVTLGLTACTDERAHTGAETPPAEADFNAAVAAYKQGDYATARKEFRVLAKRGDAKAQFYLGVMYRNGDGVTQDYMEAVKWYRKAAEQGDALAQHSLGWMYSMGLGVTQDYKEAAKWFGKALGVILVYKEAEKWFRKAAEQGDVKAQYDLGRMYNSGVGVTHDYKEAAKWFGKAAEQGFALAQHRLGWAYGGGLGVTQDYVQAHMWLYIAAANGYERARSGRDTFEKIMTAAQFAEAQKLAKEWMAKHQK